MVRQLAFTGGPDLRSFLFLQTACAELHAGVVGDRSQILDGPEIVHDAPIRATPTTTI